MLVLGSALMGYAAGCVPERDPAAYSQGVGGTAGAAADASGAGNGAGNGAAAMGGQPVDGGRTDSLESGGASPSVDFQETGSGSGLPPRRDGGLDAGLGALTCGALVGASDCLIAVSSALTWSQARAACRSIGPEWDLAHIDSEADSAALTALIVEEVWLGGSDATVEGSWQWVADGRVFWEERPQTDAATLAAFANWNLGEPNGGGNSDCLRAVPQALVGAAVAGRWADLECDRALSALCRGPRP